MFNVIKGEMVCQTSKPIIIGKKKQEEEEKNNQKIELEIKNDELNEIENVIVEKKKVLENLDIEIGKKQEDAEKIVNEMQKEAQEKIDYEIKVNQNRGYQDGYQEGIVQGKEEVIENSKKLMIRAQSILEEIVDFKTNTILDNEEVIINFAIKIAEKIIKQEVKESREIIRNNLREAIKMVPVSKELTIIVNWEDLEYIKEIKEKLMSEINGVEKIEIIENANIEKGGCILETSMGTIDASINSQIELIYEKFIEVMSNRPCNQIGCELEVNEDEGDI